MTQEQNTGPGPSHQDPAEPKEVGTETETSPQPEPGEPVDSEPVTVEPSPVPTRTDTIHGKPYTVTDDEGYRRVKDEPSAEGETEDSDDES